MTTGNCKHDRSGKSKTQRRGFPVFPARKRQLETSFKSFSSFFQPMKTFLLLTLALVAAYCQNNEHPCSSYSMDECRENVRTCQWHNGKRCNGEVHGFCASVVNPCNRVVTCAVDPKASDSTPVLFPTSCIPFGWEEVDLKRCECQNDTRKNSFDRN